MASRDGGGHGYSKTGMHKHEKGKRGRKPKGDEIYIKESIRQIAIYEQQLDAEDAEQGNNGEAGGNDSKRKSKLYAKMSALKSRVKRKQEQMF